MEELFVFIVVALAGIYAAYRFLRQFKQSPEHPGCEKCHPKTHDVLTK